MDSKPDDASQYYSFARTARAFVVASGVTFIAGSNCKLALEQARASVAFESELLAQRRTYEF